MALPLSDFALERAAILLSFAPFLASSLSGLSTFLALIWLAWRAYQVLSKPVDELTGLLGIELPTAPDVVLAGIKADGVILHWKPPDQKGVITKYSIVVNGITIGEVPPQDTAITIQGLQPSHKYNLKVYSFNAIAFSAGSDAIRVETRDTSCNDFFDPTARNRFQEASGDGYHPAPTVKPYKPLLEVEPPLSTPPPMTREHSGSITSKTTVNFQSKRTPGRRNSPASIAPDAKVKFNDTDFEPTESYRQLSERVESLRHETDEIETQIRDDLMDYEKQIQELHAQRDQLRQALKEREDASKELKRQVATLERANTSAQAKRSTQEKTLQQKEHERQKMKDDLEKWEQEVDQAHQDVARMEQEKESYRQSVQRKLEELKDQLEEELSANRCLEESIRERGVQVKELEEANKPEGEGDASFDQAEHQVQDIDGEDQQWALKFHNIQMNYVAVQGQMAEAQRIYLTLQAQLEELNRRRASQGQLYSVPALENAPSRMNSQRRRRAGSIRMDPGSGSSIGFAMSNGMPFNNSISSISPVYSPNFFYTHTMDHENGLTQSDVDRLTAGAPMSPTAGALLPSDLFSNDMDLPPTPAIEREGDNRSSPSPPLPRPGPSPQLRPTPVQQESPRGLSLNPVLPGLGAAAGPGMRSSQEYTPGSPSSIQSRPTSIWASPQQSTTHLPFQSTNDLIDSDRRSIRSTTSSIRAVSGAGASRFASFFPSRLRGKTTSDQGPPLGALNLVQTRSMPRKEHEEDPVGAERRRGSHSGTGSWMNAFSRSNTAPTRPEISGPIAAFPLSSLSTEAQNNNIATRKRPFNMFEPGMWSTNLRPSSPATTGSGDTQLPAPHLGNAGQTFGWPVNQSSPLGNEWNIATTNSWSRHPSRRPSLNSTLLTTMNQDPLVETEGSDYGVDRPSPTQAPIGTDRPQSSAGASGGQTPPKLNPAAKDFTSIFNIGNLRGGTALAPEERAAAKARVTEDKAAAKAKAEEQREQKKADAKQKRERKKAEKAEKVAEQKAAKAKNKDDKLSLDTPRADSPAFFSNFSGLGTSPATSRKSKDTPSISSTIDTNMDDSRESLDRTASLTPSETPTSAKLKDNESKESFMQKLTRKSSSSMFNMSFPSPFIGKKEGGLFGSRNNTPKLSGGEFTDEGEEGESAAEGGLLAGEKEKGGKTPGTAKANRSSWLGAGLKLGKKKVEVDRASLSEEDVGLGLS